VGWIKVGLLPPDWCSLQVKNVLQHFWYPLSLIVQFLAVIAEPIVACAHASLTRGYVMAWRAISVVVVDALSEWLLRFIDGVECDYLGHRTVSFASDYTSAS